MGMQEGRGVLRKAVKEMQMHWGETKTQWTDGNAHGFENKFLVPMDADAKMAVSAMDQMAQVLARIRHDCEPE
jgi:hypothetical protein